eukprot:CRZ02068.1 hypothetical protein [Spongospora subterranea]
MLRLRALTRLFSVKVAVDTSALGIQLPEFSGRFSSRLEEEIHRTISLLGPITVADYVRRSLLHPTLGYYTNNDVFGVKGDFITSPEISQLFGEMIGVWLTSCWKELGSPLNTSIVELGPGRGTMMADILRTVHRLGFSPSVHFIERSPLMKEIQQKTLRDLIPTTSFLWHTELSSLDPQKGEHLLFVAQEFFDALPVHQFQYTARGWRERLIASNLRPDALSPLQVVLAPIPTPACQYIPENLSPRIGDSLEICPDLVAIIDQMANRIASHRGAALVIDYGSDNPPPDTLRGIDAHKFVPFLERPGSVDVTADVNFSTIRDAINLWQGHVKATRTVSQGTFLQTMGIAHRADSLLAKCKTEVEQDNIVSGYERLVSPNAMGETYKCIAFAHQEIFDSIVGFPPPVNDIPS